MSTISATRAPVPTLGEVSSWRWNRPRRDDRDGCDDPVSYTHLDQNLDGLGAGDGRGHGRRDLPQDAVGQDDADGPQNQFGAGGLADHRVFPRGPLVRPGLEHGLSLIHI